MVQTILAQGDNNGGMVAIIANVIALLLVVVVIAGIWKTFDKAGKPGWAAIIPIYMLLSCWRLLASRSGGSFSF
jgi:hypothetical protein